MENNNGGLPFGTILNDRYRIERTIGEGGMSCIYLSRDQWQKERDVYVVVKAPIAKYLHDKWILRKVKQEAESLARLNHQGIVKLISYGKHEDIYPFIILEYIEGLPLKKIISQLSANPKRAANIFLQITQAVEHAHSLKIFHRDLKPDNVMVWKNDEGDEGIKLIDFGIARIDDSFFSSGTKPRYQIGTPHYLSPNRLRHDPDDRADDIYALGLIAYEMLTGTNPLGKARDFKDLKEFQEQIMPPRQLNPKLSKAVDREIIRALSLNQVNRHLSALDFGKNLHEALVNTKSETAPKAKNEADALPYIPKKKNQFETIKVIPAEDYLGEKQKSESDWLMAISSGEKFLLKGDYDSALIFYNAKIAENGRSDLLYARRAMAYLMKKDYENASLDCQNALKIFPNNDFAHLLRGIIYRLKLWSAEAETELLKAIQINQNNLEAALILGDIYTSRGETEKALNYYSHVCRINPNFTWAYTNRGNLYFNLVDFDAATEDFTMAIKTNPKLAWNFYQRAEAHTKNGKIEEAVKDLTKAITLSPKSAAFYNKRSKLLLDLGRNTEALADFNRIKEITSRDSFIAENQTDKKSGLASLVDYLKWSLK
ncbi:MAG TPA: tetratricopeptide repeat protein [Pyrinomonadaceae bacterium]|nr:tetratricopeptide repeat protein [Pyrinomonadaceae bacterium]